MLEVYRPGLSRRLFLSDRAPLILTEHDLSISDRRLLLSETIFVEAYPHRPNWIGVVANAAASLFLLVYPAHPMSPTGALTALVLALAAVIYGLSWTTVRVGGEEADLVFTVWGCPRALLGFTQAAEEVRHHERYRELQRRVLPPRKGRRYGPS